MTRIGLNGKPLTEKDIKKHKRLLRECGLPETLCDPVSQEELEKLISTNNKLYSGMITNCLLKI